jgi:hypothetical protein
MAILVRVSNLNHFLEGTHKGYSFGGDPIEIFENFFGTVNPFHIAVDKNGQ